MTLSQKMEDLVDEIFLIVNDLKCESECDVHASEALSWIQPESKRTAQQKIDVMVLLDDIRNELIRIDRNVIGMNQIMQKRIEEGDKSSRINRMCSQSTQCPL
jgi:hypothetical protein